MKQVKELQLALWREACRHVDISESAADLLGVVSRFVPIDAIWIFGLRRGRCDLLASAGVGGQARISLSGEDAHGVLVWARRGVVARLGDADAELVRPLALACTMGPGSIVVGGLPRDDCPEGVVAFRLLHGVEPDAAMWPLLRAALEPLAVAIDASGRFRELESHRRAAEADREAALARLGRRSLDETIIGAETGLRSILERVDLVASSDVPVLILGETGSGKEVIARALHERSGRHDGPFLRVNCGAIPSELVDSHLFGHEKGAFTGAVERRRGWFERADSGTLFLDEIGELSQAAQVRLLRVMQEGTLERVGAQSGIRVDVRIVAATHRDLAEMVRNRQFREDLWYRLAVFPLLIPPLRDRFQDIRALAQHFADRASIRFGLERFTITDEDVALLSSYDWPGNIRELGAVIDRAALLGGGRRLAIGVAMGAAPGTSASMAAAPANRPGARAHSLDDAIRAHIERALRDSRGKIEGPGGAAEMLSINPHTLRSKMRKLGLHGRSYRARSSDS